MQHKRGSTIIELLISTVIVLVILGFAAVLFKQAFTHHALTTNNMSNEQQARLALAKINSSVSQATVEANPTDFPVNTAAPIILINNVAYPGNPGSTPAIAFYRVQSLQPAAMPSPKGAPEPQYYVHIISFDGAGTVNEYVMSVANFQANAASPTPTVLAHHVTAFGVTQITNAEYQFKITISDPNLYAQEPAKTLADNVHVMAPK